MKWRERSGFQPNLHVQEPYKNNEICAKDMVFTRDVDDELLYLIVKDTVQLNGKVENVKVCKVGEKKVMKVPLAKLLLDQGLIAAIPPNCYEILDNQVTFSESAEELVTSFTKSGSHSDQDYILLDNVAEVAEMEGEAEDNGVGMESEAEDNGAGMESEAEDDNESEAEDDADENEAEDDADESEAEDDTDEGEAEDDVEILSNSDDEPSSSSGKRKLLIPLTSKTKKRRKQISSDSEDEQYGPRSSSSLKLLPIKERVLLKWVKVVYKDQVFLGKIQQVSETGKCEVKCLEHPFGVGVGEYQDLEGDEIWYDDVYETEVEPMYVQTEGGTQRLRKWRYIYEK